MKQALLILAIALFLGTSFSYAQLGGFLKSLKSEGKSCTDNVQRECGNTYGYYSLWCLGGGEKGYIESDEGFRECSDFIKKCECLASTILRNPQGSQESEVDFKDRAQKIQRIKSSLSTAGQNKSQTQKQSCSYEVQRECSQELGSRSACDPNYDRFHMYIQTENGFRHCSELVKRCECYLKEREDKNEMGNIGLREILREQAKKNADKAEAERRKQATLDSLKREATVEIFALIEDNADVNIIIGRCDAYNRSFTPLLQECKDILDSVKIAKITALLKANKLEDCLDECDEYKLSLPKGVSSNEKIIDLCEKQLVAKTKKLSKNKITPKIAKIYYDNFEKIVGRVIQKTDKIILLDGDFNRYSDDKVFLFNTAMVQISGNVGACILPGYNGDSFFGNAQYIGMTTYTTLLGESKTVPNYRLLWCDNLRGK